MTTDDATPPAASTGEDSVEAFLSDLRSLRDAQQPPPSYKAMAQRAGWRGHATSHGSMHNAYRGDSLPTEAVLRSYVAALVGTQHIDSWVRRRAALADAADTTATPPPAPGPGKAASHTGAPPDRRPTHRPRWRWWCAAAAVVVVSNIITAVVVDQIATPDPKQGGATASVTTGTDPGTRPECLRDAVVAASSQEQTFLLKLLYSATCNAEWGKIERDDTLGKGNTIRLTLYRRDDPTSPATQTADEPDVQSAYTPMIVRRDPTDRICVTGSITTGLATIEAQRPICS